MLSSIPAARRACRMARMVCRLSERPLLAGVLILLGGVLCGCRGPRLFPIGATALTAPQGDADDRHAPLGFGPAPDPAADDRDTDPDPLRPDPRVDEGASPDADATLEGTQPAKVRPLLRHFEADGLDVAAPAPAGAAVLARTVPVAGNAIAMIDPGRYAKDPRFALLARDWPARVEEAVALFVDRTGLGFAEGPPVRVVLVPLEDERIAHRVATQILDGRRQAIVSINAEPLVAARVRADTQIVRGLAEAVFELVALRHSPVPRWVAAFAGSVASADLDPRIQRLGRDAVLGSPGGTRVDRTDPNAAAATGLAVHAVLQDRGLLDKARDILVYAAQGDDAEWPLTRILHEADGSWIGPARVALLARLRALDQRPWQHLIRAEAAWKELGRAGLEAALSPPLDRRIQGEARVLLARAAIAEGDWRTARRNLAALTVRERVELRSPAAALALEVEVLNRPGGDAALARTKMRELDLDYPASAARRELRAQNPLLGCAENPRAWVSQIRVRIAREGTADFQLATLQRVLRVLLIDFRLGAAARLVDALGDRAEAPELEAVIQLVNAAQREPSVAAVEANRARLVAWQAAPSDRTRAEVEDGGRAAWAPTFDLLRKVQQRERGPFVRLLVKLSGVSDTCRALAPVWRRAPRVASIDLEAISRHVDARVLRRTLSFLAPSILSRTVVEQLWMDVAFDIDAGWLDAHPAILSDLRAEAYAKRRSALDTVVLADRATPALIGRLAKDPSSLLRQEAVRVGGHAGFVALSREALRDASPSVRAAGVEAVARAEGRPALDLILERLQKDPARIVRVAAATALLDIAPREAPVLDALLRTQATEDAGVRDAVAARLVDHLKVPTAAALTRAYQRELALARPDAPLLARYIVLFQRVSGRDVGFVPGAPKRDLVRIARGMADWSRRAAEAEAGTGGRQDPPRSR